MLCAGVVALLASWMAEKQRTKPWMFSVDVTGWHGRLNQSVLLMHFCSSSDRSKLCFLTYRVPHANG